MATRLRTIHPNPGPVKRRGIRGKNKTDAKRKDRLARRYLKRKKKRSHTTRQTNDITIVTWNVQGVSLRENNRNRLRCILDYVEKQGWEVVLLTEIKSEDEGVLWFGEGKDMIALVHSHKTGIVLRGSLLQCWIDGQERQHHSERTTTVILRNIRVVAVYQPLWSNGKDQVDIYRHEIERQLALSPQTEVLVIGGDHNAQIGDNTERPGVSGNYGLKTQTNEAGDDLLGWCEINGLSYANSYLCHPSRGTWFNRSWRRWYELDGFLVKKTQRHRILKRMVTVNEMSMSDHKPKLLSITVRQKKWRRYDDKRTPQINWAKLKDPEQRAVFEAKTELKFDNQRPKFNEDGTNWDMLTGILTSSALEVCGKTTRKVANPCTLGHED